MLVLFDFDGTLVDSFDLSVRIFAEIGPRLNLKPLPDPGAARHTPTRVLLKQMGVRFWQVPRIVREFQAAAAGHAPELKLFPGVAAMLTDLRAAGHRLGVLSSNREDTIRTALAANGVAAHFAFVGGSATLFGKAGAIRRVLKSERVARADAVYVGDELRDIEAARKAGIRCIAAAWGGFHAAALLETGRPAGVAAAPAGLPVLLQQLRDGLV